MNQDPDVIVIGGGAIGICSAYYLWRSGLRVAVLEKNQIGSGCSQGNAGLIVPSHVVPLAAPGVMAQGLRWMMKPASPFYIRPRLSSALFSWIWHFRNACHVERMRRSMPVLHEMIQASMPLFDELAGLDHTRFEYHRNGLLMVFNSEKGRKSCWKDAGLGQDVGLETRILDADQLRALEPAVPNDMIGGVFYPGDAHVDPAQFVSALAGFLISHGVSIHTNTTVCGFETAAGQVTALQTNRGLFRAKQIVLAGGSWSPGIARSLGLRLPVQPAKGYSVDLQEPSRSPRIPLILSEAKVAITPLQNRLRFAGTLELAGLDDTINRRRAETILKVAPHYFDDFQPSTVPTGQIWSGFRPCSPDGLPLLGRSRKWQNLIVATGHAMIGMTLAPITGRLVEQLANERATCLDLTPMRVERFRFG